jgi:hypothetical protein
MIFDDPANQRLLDGKAAARLLGCTPAALALWRKEHRGPSYVRIGRRLIRYRPEDVRIWVDGCRVQMPSRGD